MVVLFSYLHSTFTEIIKCYRVNYYIALIIKYSK